MRFYWLKRSLRCAFGIVLFVFTSASNMVKKVSNYEKFEPIKDKGIPYMSPKEIGDAHVQSLWFAGFFIMWHFFATTQHLADSVTKNRVRKVDL